MQISLSATGLQSQKSAVAQLVERLRTPFACYRVSTPRIILPRCGAFPLVGASFRAPWVEDPDMAKLNTSPKRGARKEALRLNSHWTHGGAPAAHIGALAQLRRSVMSCLLWEDEHYESGESIAARIAKHAAEVTPVELAQNCRRGPSCSQATPCAAVAARDASSKTGKGQRGLIARHD